MMKIVYWRHYLMGAVGLALGGTLAYLHPAVKLPSSAMALPVNRVAAPRTRAVSEGHSGGIEGSYDTALAFVTKGQNSPFDCGALSGVPIFTALTEGDQVTDRSLASMGISSLKKAAIQQVVDASLARTEKLLAGRVREDPLASDPARGIVAYDVPPDPEAGHELVEQFRQDLIAVLGEEQTNALGNPLFLTPSIAHFGLQGLSVREITDPGTGEKTILGETYQPMTRAMSSSFKVNALTRPELLQSPMIRFAQEHILHH